MASPLISCELLFCIERLFVLVLVLKPYIAQKFCTGRIGTNDLEATSSRRRQTKPTELLGPKTRSVRGIHYEENVWTDFRLFLFLKRFPKRFQILKMPVALNAVNTAPISIRPRVIAIISSHL
jgi:hypothetical protein